MKLTAAVAAATFLLAGCAQQDASPGDQGGSLTGDAALIAEAESAAPASIGSGATIMAWPDTEGGEPRQVRAGTNNWVCFPSSPGSTPESGIDPMCLDPVFQQWAQAWMTKGVPNLTTTGFAYMLRGDRGASNTDPFATDSTADNNWVRTGSHVMVVAPTAALASLGSTPGPEPWVMWQGTPYAHVMIPVD